jgi:hypothetical protein
MGRPQHRAYRQQTRIEKMAPSTKAGPQERQPLVWAGVPVCANPTDRFSVPGKAVEVCLADTQVC